MPEKLSKTDWQHLLDRIKAGNCTPFIGAGASSPPLRLGADIARQWSKDSKYPLDDSHDLARVAQYRAIYEDDSIKPKEDIAKAIRAAAPPDFSDPDEPHAVLAGLKLPVYITTNYDDFMTGALRAQGKDPRLELCRWNDYVRKYVKSPLAKGRYDPSDTKPVVFHLHGHVDTPQSLVLTEDDYFDLLAQIGERRSPIPLRIQRSLAGASLLFLGYRIVDWDFRVLFRIIHTSLTNNIRPSHISVQMAPVRSPRRATAARRYLDSYFRRLDVRIYWGTAREFVHDLRERL